MGVLLAIDPTTKLMGWAVFVRESSPEARGTVGTGEASSSEGGEPHPHWCILETGVVMAHYQAQPAETTERIKSIGYELDRVVQRWGPEEVACGKPSPLQLPHQKEGIDMLTRSLESWAQRRSLKLFCYPHREIRVAISGRANASKDEMAYMIMTRWRLLGEGKSTHEWNAIAVGDYHLILHDSR